MTSFFDPWQRDEIDRLAKTIMWIQDAVGLHFPWCDALIVDSRLPCSCGMDAMRVNRAFLLEERLRPRRRRMARPAANQSEETTL